MHELLRATQETLDGLECNLCGRTIRNKDTYDSAAPFILPYDLIFVSLRYLAVTKLALLPLMS